MKHLWAHEELIGNFTLSRGLGSNGTENTVKRLFPLQ